jgi:serine/tyrosine/threonine adenylyltransferase
VTQAMFDNSYAKLPERFYVPTTPSNVKQPRLIRFNATLAHEIGLELKTTDEAELAELFSGNRLDPSSRPLAQAYAGHQFGNFVPQLGDGRAVLLGEVVGPDGIRRDVQLKGSGRTAFSRGGDGRAALGPVLREYIVSEAMAVHGVPTTRSLAAVLTGEQVFREALIPGAVLTRVARSHIRIGTFQFFAARGDEDGVRALADYAIERHYPAAREAANPYRAFFEAVVAAQADLVARWMLLGFIHGVMNTDNMAISGETIDYGPCAFLDTYHPSKVFSSIDRQGRYAYSNQPGIAQWNLSRLAEALLPLLDPDKDRAVSFAQETLASFGTRFEQRFNAGMREKIGLAGEHEGDLDLLRDLMKLMAVNEVDFTLGFRALTDAAGGEDERLSIFGSKQDFDPWQERWRVRLEDEQTGREERAGMMKRANPIYIPRNHLIEAAIRAAVEDENFAPFHDLVEVLVNPFEERGGLEDYALPPRPEEVVTQTFCGT